VSHCVASPPSPVHTHDSYLSFLYTTHSPYAHVIPIYTTDTALCTCSPPRVPQQLEPSAMRIHLNCSVSGLDDTCFILLWPCPACTQHLPLPKTLTCADKASGPSPRPAAKWTRYQLYRYCGYGCVQVHAIVCSEWQCAAVAMCCSRGWGGGNVQYCTIYQVLY
jgi:hypothetical protein